MSYVCTLQSYAIKKNEKASVMRPQLNTSLAARFVKLNHLSLGNSYIQKNKYV